MPGIALALAFVGYSVSYYGVTQIRGGNWGLLDLIVPSRWSTKRDIPPDTGASVKVGTLPPGGVDTGGVASSVQSSGLPGQPSSQPIVIFPQAGGKTAVDQFGNTYNNVNGVWIPTLSTTGAGSNVNTPGGPSIPGLGSGVPVA